MSLALLKKSLDVLTCSYTNDDEITAWHKQCMDVIAEIREALAAQPEQEQEPVATAYFEKITGRIVPPDDTHRRKFPMCYRPLVFSDTSPQPAQRPHECSRSHPHENMDAMCELRTEIARLTNENARLKAASPDRRR